MAQVQSASPAPKKRRTKKAQASGVEVSLTGQQVAKNGYAAAAELSKTIDRIQDINLTKAAMSVDKRAGFIFEEFHAGTFNAAARKTGDHVTTAKTGIDAGFVNDPRVDIVVTNGKKKLAEVQAKCCGSVGRSAVSVAKKKYAGTDRLVASDQAEEVKSALKRSAAKKVTSSNPAVQAKGLDRAEAAKKVTDRIKAKGHSSKPVTHAETQNMAKGDLRALERMAAKESLSSAAKGGATAGAAIGGGLSVATNVYDAVTRKKTVKEAAMEVGKDTVVSAARGAASAALTEGVKVGAKQVLGKEAVKSLIKGSGPAAIAGCAIDMVEDAVKGELTVKKATKNVGKAGSAWAGAEGGAVVGAMIGGPPGAIIGGIVGGLAASLGFSALFD